MYIDFGDNQGGATGSFLINDVINSQENVHKRGWVFTMSEIADDYKKAFQVLDAAKNLYYLPYRGLSRFEGFEIYHQPQFITTTAVTAAGVFKIAFNFEYSPKGRFILSEDLVTLVSKLEIRRTIRNQYINDLKAAINTAASSYIATYNSLQASKKGVEGINAQINSNNLLIADWTRNISITNSTLTQLLTTIETQRNLVRTTRIQYDTLINTNTTLTISYENIQKTIVSINEQMTKGKAAQEELKKRAVAEKAAFYKAVDNLTAEVHFYKTVIETARDTLLTKKITEFTVVLDNIFN